MSHPSSRRARAGFTLVELLVVVGIIALLIAILMPSLAAARRHAQRIKCGSHLRSIGQAMQQYANEYKGRVPRDYFYDDQYRRGHILWAEALAKYIGEVVPDVTDHSEARDNLLAPVLKRIEVYQCPAFPDDEQPLDYVSNAWEAGSTPGVSTPLVNIAKVKHSPKIVYLTEAAARSNRTRFGYHDVWHVDHFPYSIAGMPQQNSTRILNDTRHGGRLNLLFLDGHVEDRHFREVGPRDFDPLMHG